MKVRIEIEAENDGEMLDLLAAFPYCEVAGGRRITKKDDFGFCVVSECLERLSELRSLRYEAEREARLAAAVEAS
jgi:hypothetical protein